VNTPWRWFRRRVTSLRTRSFVVIVIAVLIPALCLSVLGVWVYFRTWNHAGVVYTAKAQGQALELSNEINTLSTMPKRYAPAERALLSSAIATAYGNGQTYGAGASTLAEIKDQHILPTWAITRLQKDSFAIGTSTGPTTLAHADLIAWRVGPTTVRFYNTSWPEQPLPVYAPMGRLLSIGLLVGALIIVLGLLGAWVLSRSVIRPVRRLAEASSRLAEGDGGVTVIPEGPRELRELATSFNNMNTKLTKAQETEQAFLLSVSHELKTPLTSIRGYAEGLADRTIKPSAAAAVIGKESGRLERLVGDLLDSARMRKSAFTVHQEMVDLAALAGEVARRYEATADEAGLTLHVRAEAGGAAVADGDRILQAVSNLVENAIRCTRPPGTVTIATGPGMVTVSDTGPGLTNDDLPHAFERFYLYDRYGGDRPVGTGLGLAIVKELVEAMGGSVGVSSATGVGTAFSVTLPVYGES
jgi:signal transduction histidine kinase